jgi:hypothetical protein
MDPQLISMYVSFIAGLTRRIRPVVRYPIVFAATSMIFLIGSLVTVWAINGREKSLASIEWLLTTHNGILITTAVGVVGTLFVWVAVLLDPPEEEEYKSDEHRSRD